MNLFHFLASFDSATSLFLYTFQQYGFIALLVGTFFLGETLIIVAILLSQQGIVSLQEVFIAATLGGLLADMFWFTVGRHFLTKIISEAAHKKYLSPAHDFFTKWINHHILISITLFKFFIGLRLLFILYISQQKVTWPRFVLYDILGTLIYMSVICIAGASVGQLLNTVLPVFHTIGSIVTGLLIFFILSHFIRRLVLGKKSTA